MRARNLDAPWGWVVKAASLVYRDTAARAGLLGQALRRRDRIEIPFEDRLAANAEPVILPEPLLRTKVG